MRPPGPEQLTTAQRRDLLMVVSVWQFTQGTQKHPHGRPIYLRTGWRLEALQLVQRRKGKRRWPPKLWTPTAQGVLWAETLAKGGSL